MSGTLLRCATAFYVNHNILCLHPLYDKLWSSNPITTFFTCVVKNITLYLQNNYKSVTVTGLLNSYEPITLYEMSGIRLMNRTDVKFITTKKMLAGFLLMAHDDYLVHETKGKRMASYYTVYFDTERCDMFMVHHNRCIRRLRMMERLRQN